MASLCYMRGEAQPMMAWLISGVKVKSRSHLINQWLDVLVWLCIDLWAAIINGPQPSALGYYGCQYKGHPTTGNQNKLKEVWGR